jgi:hypothetical protein
MDEMVSIGGRKCSMLLASQAFRQAALQSDHIRRYVRLHKTPPHRRHSKTLAAEQQARELLKVCWGLRWGSL